MGIRIGDRDWGPGLGTGIGDWDWGLGIGIGDWDWGLGIDEIIEIRIMIKTRL